MAGNLFFFHTMRLVCISSTATWFGSARLCSNALSPYVFQQQQQQQQKKQKQKQQQQRQGQLYLGYFRSEPAECSDGKLRGMRLLCRAEYFEKGSVKR